MELLERITLLYDTYYQLLENLSGERITLSEAGRICDSKEAELNLLEKEISKPLYNHTPIRQKFFETIELRDQILTTIESDGSRRD